VTITYDGDNRVVELEPGKSLLDHSLEHGIEHAHVCHGNARCSTCRVLVLEGLEHLPPRNEAEGALADKLGLAREVRLACQSTAAGPIRVRRLIRDDQDMRLFRGADRAHERRLAILFADIRNFTPFTERHLPYDVVHILNRYFEAMGGAILRHGGTIDKYLGDGIMALFGVDDASGPECCEEAVTAAGEMLIRLVPFNGYLKRHFDEEFRVGIGVHYGRAVVGELGHSEYRHRTAIGDAVNTAARVEAATKTTGAPLLVTAAVMDQLDEAGWTEHTVQLKGKIGTSTLYSPPG